MTAPVEYIKPRSQKEEAFFDTVAELLDEVLKKRTDACGQSCVLLAMQAKGLAMDVVGEARRKLAELEQ